jgi:hypothetical protein
LWLILIHYPNFCLEDVRKSIKKLRITSPWANIQNQDVLEVKPQLSAYTASSLQFPKFIVPLYLDSKNTSGIYLPLTKIWREETN